MREQRGPLRSRAGRSRGWHTLVITTLDRLGRSTQNMLDFAKELRGRGAGLRVLNLGAAA